MKRTVRTRRRAPAGVVDERAPSRQIGTRLRAARLRAGLTQQQLAGDQYTKAYVSALENALVRPSMRALEYLAGRLNLEPSDLIEDPLPAWNRLEADLHLAAGDWQTAADAYVGLLDETQDRTARAGLQAGLAEALCRLDRSAEAISAASAAAETFTGLGRRGDAARASYWLAFGLHERDNAAEARSVLTAILDELRAGLEIDPDFKVRILMALAMVDSRDGEPERALSYLLEASGAAEELDDRRRATYLFSLALSYRATGDLEAAIRAGLQSLSLFRAAEAQSESARVENELALAYLELGNVSRARELASAARARFDKLGDRRLLAHVADTEARVALAAGDAETARRLTHEAIEISEETGNRNALLDALLTDARASLAVGQLVEAGASFERAAGIARQGESAARLREVLTEWADVLARRGDHAGAYALSREALTASR